MNEAIYIFSIILASEDGGRTNKVERFQCECDTYLEALEQVTNYCKHSPLHVVCIEEDYAAEMEL